MSVQELETTLVPVYSPAEIVKQQQQLAGGYKQHYQPPFADTIDLQNNVEQLQAVETVTTPRHIERLQSELTDLAEGRRHDGIAVAGRCAEEIKDTISIQAHVEQALRNIAIVKQELGATAIGVVRAMGQYAKPRSAETETRDGTQVISYMGDVIHDKDGDRTPDPSRMVKGAEQAHAVEAALTEAVGDHVYSAHEALLLPYETAHIFEDPENGKRYLLSTDMPWIGKRTNQLGGAHVEMLRGIENPIGIKVGADSTPEHIAGLHQTLNPGNEANPEGIPGKLTFMVRVESHQQDELRNITRAIAEHSPNSIIMYDIHGVTKSRDGHKIRAVSEIIADIKMMSDICYQEGVTLHGVHLETVMDDAQLQCVATPDQTPLHPGGVDPQLNPEQLEEVLEAIQQYLMRPKKQHSSAGVTASSSGPWVAAVDGMVRDGHL